MTTRYQCNSYHWIEFFDPHGVFIIIGYTFIKVGKDGGKMEYVFFLKHLQGYMFDAEDRHIQRIGKLNKWIASCTLMLKHDIFY